MNRATGDTKGHASRALLIAAFGRGGGRPLFPQWSPPSPSTPATLNCPLLLIPTSNEMLDFRGVLDRSTSRSSILCQPGRFFWGRWSPKRGPGRLRRLVLPIDPFVTPGYKQLNQRCAGPGWAPSPERVGAFLRNRWAESIGMGGRLHRNTQSVGARVRPRRGSCDHHTITGWVKQRSDRSNARREVERTRSIRRLPGTSPGCLLLAPPPARAQGRNRGDCRLGYPRMKVQDVVTNSPAAFRRLDHTEPNARFMTVKEARRAVGTREPNVLTVPLGMEEGSVPRRRSSRPS
jgi:hypothetical protein